MDISADPKEIKWVITELRSGSLQSLPYPMSPPAYCLWENLSQKSLLREVRACRNRGSSQRRADNSGLIIKQSQGPSAPPAYVSLLACLSVFAPQPLLQASPLQAFSAPPACTAQCALGIFPPWPGFHSRPPPAMIPAGACAATMAGCRPDALG